MLRSGLLPLWNSLDGDFIVSESNLTAYEAVTQPESWPDRRLLLCGQGPWGKSHLVRLLAARGYRIKEAGGVGKRVVWDNFPTEVGKKAGEVIFHAWNQIVASGGFLCVVMRAPPHLCHLEPPDLKSRLVSTFSVKVGPPNYELRKQIFQQWLRNGGIEIGEKALSYFFTHYDSDLRHLAESAKTLQAFALGRQRGMTVECIKRALSLGGKLLPTVL